MSYLYKVLLTYTVLLIHGFNQTFQLNIYFNLTAPSTTTVVTVQQLLLPNKHYHQYFKTSGKWWCWNILSNRSKHSSQHHVDLNSRIISLSRSTVSIHRCSCIQAPNIPMFTNSKNIYYILLPK